MRVLPVALAALLLSLPALGGDPVPVAGFETISEVVAADVANRGEWSVVATRGQVTLLDRNFRPVWDKKLDEISGVAISAKGDLIVVSSGPKILLLNRAGEEQWSTGFPQQVLSVDITPTGNRIVATAGKFVYLVDRDSRQLWKHDTLYLKTRAVISADGNYVGAISLKEGILMNHSQREVDMRKFETYRAPVTSLSDEEASFQRIEMASVALREPALSDTIPNLTVGSSDGNYYVFDKTGRYFKVQASVARLPVVSIASVPFGVFTAIGSEVAFFGPVGDLRWKTRGQDQVLTVATSPDDRFLIYGGKDRRVRIVDLSPLLPTYLYVNTTSGPLNNSTPAEVYVDGERLGVAPAKFEVTAGLRRVRVVNRSFGEMNRRVELAPGQTTDLLVNLSNLIPDSTLLVTTDPPGADVSLDGALLGKSPINESFSAGNYTLRVSLSGHKEFSQMVTLSRGNTTRLNVSMAKADSVEVSKPQEFGSAALPSTPEPTKTPFVPTPTPEPPGFEAVFAVGALILAGMLRRRKP
ncbi:MAG: PEGA domain-containing protein [Euryarchaeota archaeon]|nr:PEGA domain-containing protein [Euryarchaeota archaeon]